MALALAPTKAKGRPGRPRLMLPPKCPLHPGSAVYLDGPLPQWSEFYEKRLWRCHPQGKAKGRPGHTFVPGELMRHPTHHLPDFGGECPHCENEYGPDEGPKIGRGFTLVAEEAASTLALIGMGESYRNAAMLTRQKAKRYQFDPSQNRWRTDPVTKRKTLLYTGAARDRVKDRYSRQCNLSAYYLDVFGPAVVDRLARKAWPEVIVLDSQPLKTRAFAAGRGKGTPGGAAAGEILAAVDRTSRPGRALSMWMAGGKNASEWRRFFTRSDFDPSSAPSWIVSDLDPGIENAVAEVWPQAIHFKCEGHLMRNAVEKAAADGVPEWVAKPGTTAGALVPRPDTKRDREAVWPASQPKQLFERHPLFVAMEVMFRTLASWDAFKAAVETHVPAHKKALRTWIADREALVLKQFELKAQHPGMPVSNGAVEGLLVWARSKFVGRAGRLTNVRRVQIALDLMVLFRAGRANEQLYARAIRSHMRAQANRGSGVTRAEWPIRFWDPKGTSSLDQIVGRAVKEVREEKSKANLERATRRLALLDEAEEQARAAAGEAISRGRKRRPEGSPDRATSTSRRGKFVSDFPAIAAQWDHEANGERDPATTRAVDTKPAYWICRAHLDDVEPHEHRWKTAPGRRTQRETGCPFCMNRRACAANSFGRTDPRFIKEWAPDGNADRTPFNTLRGASTYAMWLCLRSNGEHPPYRQRVSAHILAFQGCPLHDDVGDKARAREERRREQNALEADRTRQRLTASSPVTQASADHLPVGLHGEPVPPDLTLAESDALPQLVWPVDTVLDFGAEPDDEDF